MEPGRCLGLVLLLGGCGLGGGSASELPGVPIVCAVDGVQEFTPDCRLERATVEGAQVLIVRHPDGAFHRLEVSADGQNLNAADGADTTQSALKGDRWEVILGENRYVIPVKANAAQQ